MPRELRLSSDVREALRHELDHPRMRARSSTTFPMGPIAAVLLVVTGLVAVVALASGDGPSPSALGPLIVPTAFIVVRIMAKRGRI
jgi:hypothetical protein